MGGEWLNPSDKEPFEVKFPRLVAKLDERFAESRRMASAISTRLSEIIS